ncbi:LysR family transcriptional regulator [Rhizobium halophytocola]|uniref:DNA-binding transcriptional LysR family regulator n=1 Tax=Rhizobium halophytocola TaxID=735519 RepID=A0ABS4E4M2_9HYPH|nr:LysR family transcriptional regulator [Rhizobium halophytocola]MBP1852901.1 DNA-binding transcriptional LysR family regulator [Rhizobium halophytocola]
MSDRWQQLTVFVRVAESGSFSQTARDLRLSQPSVSRIVTELEERVGVKLLIRTTRHLTLTEAGATFLAKARDVITTIEEAEYAARKTDSLDGVVRLALPTAYGSRAIMPLLPSFMEAYPNLQVEILMADERQNLVVDGDDIAIRTGALPDSTFGARRIASLERMVVASPAYFAKKGTPVTPGALSAHDCILGYGAFGRGAWRFKRGNTLISVDIRSRLTINSAPGILAASLQGLGLAIVSDVMSADERADNRLVRVLEGYTLEPAAVYAVYTSGPKPSRKVKALIDHLIRGLRPAG